jgi:multiple sugar transport system permease protein
VPEGRAPGSGPWDIGFGEEARAMVEMATVSRPVSPNGEHRPRTAGTRTAQRRSSLHAGESKMGVLMVIPTVAGIVVFTAGPIVASFALSLFRWNVINNPKFIGLSNYRSLVHDSVVLKAFFTTAIMAVSIVGLQLTLGLVLAIAVERRRGAQLRKLYRAAFFFPLMTSAASISIVMGYIFDDHFGVVNYYLTLLHLPAVPWLGSTAGSVVTVVLVVVWQQLGFTFILFVAALGNVPQELIEASAVDGASSRQRFRKITLPMISPTVLFAAIVGLINSLQIFDQPYIMTQGGPGNATNTVVMTLYEAGFEDLKFGYASAISVFLFVAVLILTAAQFRISRRWVYYSSAEGA